MKTRRVLGTAKVTCPCKQLRYDERILNGLACAQEVELAIYEEIQPKRELVVPEGISWQQNLMRHKTKGQEYLLSINDGSLIGSVREDDDKWFWRAEYYNTGWRSTMREAEEAVYETFADLNRFDFSWKTPEPDWSRYECVTAWRRCTESNIRWQWERRNFPNHIDKEILYDHFQNSKYLSDVNMAIIEGRLPDGSVEIIDRWSEEEKGN